MPAEGGCGCADAGARMVKADANAKQSFIVPPPFFPSPAAAGPARVHPRRTRAITYASFVCADRSVQGSRIEDDMLDPLAFPRIGDVNQAVGALNHRRIRVFARIAFEHTRRRPRLSIPGHRDVQG